MSALTIALEKLKSTDVLTDQHLILLETHFKSLDRIVHENPALECVRLYTVLNLNKVQDMIRARKGI